MEIHVICLPFIMKPSCKFFNNISKNIALQWRTIEDVERQSVTYVFVTSNKSGFVTCSKSVSLIGYAQYKPTFTTLIVESKPL